MYTEINAREACYIAICVVRRANAAVMGLAMTGVGGCMTDGL
jgi:hypothetical protein